MQCMTAEHRVKMNIKERAGPVVESNSDATDYKPQSPLMTFVKPPSDTRSNIKQALADIGVLTNIIVKGIVESLLTKGTNTLQCWIIMSAEYTSKNALKAKNFKSNKDIKFSMFNVVEQALGEKVRSGRAPTAKVGIIVQVKAAASTFVQGALFNTRFIVSIAETVGKMA